MLFEVTVILTFDTNSNQIILKSKWKFVPHLKKFPQDVPDILVMKMEQMDNQKSKWHQSWLSQRHEKIEAYQVLIEL